MFLNGWSVAHLHQNHEGSLSKLADSWTLRATESNYTEAGPRNSRLSKSSPADSSVHLS